MQQSTLLEKERVLGGFASSEKGSADVVSSSPGRSPCTEYLGMGRAWAESAGRVRWGCLLEQGHSGRQGRRLGQQQAHTWQPGHRGWVQTCSTAPGTPVPVTRKEFGYEEAFMLE